MRVALSSLTWLILSSAPVCLAQQWQWLNPRPQGDPIKQIFFVDRQHGWMAIASNNLLRTIDGGTTWKMIPTGFETHTLMFVNPLEGWAVGARDGFDFFIGVYRTTDGGLSWVNVLPETLRVTDVSAVHLFFTDRRNGWFGVQYRLAIGGVLKTTDGGVTWSLKASEALHDGLAPRGVLGIAFRDSLRGIVGSFLFSVITTDGGETWRRDSSLARYSQFFFTDSLHGWAGDGNVPKRTTDGGLTWQTIPTPKIGKIFPLSAAECYLYGDGVFFTSDTGKTWELRSSTAFELMHFTSKEHGWSAQWFRGNYYRTNDGGRTWARQDENVFTSEYSHINGVHFLTQSLGWVTGLVFSPPASPIGFLAKTTDGGNTWTISNPIGAGSQVQFLNEATGWLTFGTIYKTTDGGSTWHIQNTGTSNSLIKAHFLNERIGWAVGDGVLVKTTNGGETWEPKNYGVPTLLDEIQFVDSLHGWAAGISFRSDTYPIYIRTTDGGESWTQLFPDPNFTVTRVSFRDPLNGWGIMTQRQSAAFKVVVTSDGGLSWQERLARSGDSRGGLFSGHIRFVDSMNGFVAGGFGTFLFTTDGGSTWHNESGKVSRWINRLSVVDRNVVYLVGWNGMVVKRTASGPTSVREEISNPFLPVADLILYPAYPNPFNAETTVSYDLLQPNEVTIEVYDVGGKRLQRWFLGRQETGTHLFRFDASQLASGLLFIRVTAGETTATQKAVLIK